MPKPYNPSFETGPGQGAGRPGPPGPPGAGFSAGLDLTGTSKEQTVIGFRTVPLSNDPPNDGDAYVFDVSLGEWVPGPAGGGTVPRLSRHLFVDGGTAVAPMFQDGSIGKPFSTLQTALDVVNAGASGSLWSVFMTPGDYEESLSFFGDRRIAIVSPGYGLVSINASSYSSVSWTITSNSTLFLRNIVISSVTASDGPNDAPNVGSLFLDNSSVATITCGAYTVDVTVTGPSSFVGSASVSGIFVADGSNHISTVSADVVEIHSTTVDGSITATVGNAYCVDVSFDSSASVHLTGYGQILYVDDVSKYWIGVNSVPVSGGTIVLMAQDGNVTPLSAVLYVDNGRTVSSPDGSIANPFTTLAAGITAAAALSVGSVTLIVVPGDYSGEGTLSWSHFSPVLNLEAADGGVLGQGNGTMNIGGAGTVILSAFSGNNAGVRMTGISVRGGMTLTSSALSAIRCDFNQNYPSTIVGDGMISAWDCAFYSSFSMGVSDFSAQDCLFPNGALFTASGTKVGLLGCDLSGNPSNVLFSDSAGVVSMDDLTFSFWGSQAPTLTNGTVRVYGFYERNATPVPFTGASNTISNRNVGALTKVSHTVTSTVIVPTNTAVPLPIGIELEFAAIGAGQVVFSPFDGTVTVDSAETLKLRKQWSAGTLIKLGFNHWLLVGDLELSP